MYRSYKKNLFKFLSHLRLLIILLLLAAQFAVMLLFILRLRDYIKYYWMVSMLMSFVFIIYICNVYTKNEFKIAWLLPVIMAPLFGITLYTIFDLNNGKKRTAQRLKKIKTESKEFLYTNTQKVYGAYPKVTDISEYLLAVDNYPPYFNNGSTYFPNGESMVETLLHDIGSAKKFIFIEYFIIEPSLFWDSILKILEAKVSDGVEVRLLFDGFGSMAISSRSYMKILRQKGINAKTFFPFIPVIDISLNNRDHRKIFDIDGRICYTGGINLTDEYINEDHSRFDYWKDSGIRIEGSAADSFTAMFLQMWNLADKRTAKCDYADYINNNHNTLTHKGVLIPYADDAFNEEDIAENVYSYIISRSHTYIHIMTPYIILDNSFMNALCFAAKRKVDVSIIVPFTYDHLITFCVGRVFIRKLMQKGIKIYAYKKGFIHSKVFVADGNRATVGSVNVDYRSFSHHFECGCFMYHSPEIDDIENDFQKTLKDCEEITMETYRKIPWIQRTLGCIFKPIATLL